MCSDIEGNDSNRLKRVGEYYTFSIVAKIDKCFYCHNNTGSCFY